MTTSDNAAPLIAQAEKYLTKNYRQQPIVLQKGLGCEVWDVDGKRYLDLTGGIAACPLGHAHPALVRAISEQAGRLIHVSNLFFIEEQIRLAAGLSARALAMGDVRLFFCNSGAEANESAVKLAKRYQTKIKGAAERVNVFSFEGSFHGRTVATVGLTGQEKYRTGFGPLIEWARFLPFPTDAPSDVSRVLDMIDQSAAAVIIEPIQAEGGIRIPPPGFLKKLRQRCNDTGTVLIFDEVQTGIGRTGTFFGYEVEGVVPDVMSLAKGLGGGVPIGAMVAKEEFARAFDPGSHASTFGGNPLAAAAALCVMETINRDKLLANVVARGEHLEKRLGELCKKYPTRALGTRGRGLLRGLALGEDAAPIMQKVRGKGVLLSVAGGTVVRFAPPLIVTDAQLDEGVRALDSVLGE